AAPAASPLEGLLADRVCVSWLAVYYDEIALAGQLQKFSATALATQAIQKRLDRAHARHLSAIKALATGRKLVKPQPAALELLSRPVGETDLAGAAGRWQPTANPAQGVGVAN